MDEKRQFNRWYVEGTRRVRISGEGMQEEATMIDVSAGGMKVTLSQALPPNATVYGEVEVLPQMRPFFIKGKVLRVNKKDNLFETGISFEKISTIPLAE